MPAADNEQDKAIPVKALYFGQMVKWPGVAGAGNVLMVGKPLNAMAQNIMYAESIFEYKGQFCINAQHWMPKSCAYLLCYEY